MKPWRACHLALTAGLMFGCADSAQPPPKRPRPVRFAAIANATTGVASDFSATVRSRDSSQISVRVGGTLTSITVKRGDQVKEGQTLAALDQRDLKVQVAQAGASMSSARSQRDLARRTFRRTEKLYASGAATRADYDNAKGQLRSAEAQLAAAGQAVRQAKNSLNYTTLVAPFGGVVTAVNAKVGETVGVGAPVIVLSRGGELEAVLGVPEGVVSDIKAGMKATVTVPALDKTPRPGTVREVGFAPERNTYPVSIALDAADAALRPGMAANVHFEFGERRQQLVVPVAAVGNDGGSSFVFELTQAGAHYTVKKRAIEVGALMGDAYVLDGGLEAGAKVATAGLGNLVEGMTVRLLEPGEAR